MKSFKDHFERGKFELYDYLVSAYNLSFEMSLKKVWHIQEYLSCIIFNQKQLSADREDIQKEVVGQY